MIELFQNIPQFYEYIFIGVYSIILIITVVIILFDTNNPTKALFYLFLTITIPFVGIAFYYSFGINHRKHKFHKRKISADKQIVKQLDQLFIQQQNDFERIISQNLKHFKSLAYFLFNDGKELFGQNNYQILINGEEKFPELFKSINNAKKFIHIEYYIWKNDKIGNEFKDILISAFNRGVEIRIIYDDFGSNGIRKNIVKELKDIGIKIFPIIKIKFIGLANRLNHRDHRKIVIIDGEIAFIGGINIADNYDNRQNNKVYWRDIHLKISGYTVNNLQRHFISSWNTCSDEELKVNNIYFPTLFTPYNTINKGFAQIIAGGPDYKHSYILLSFLKIFSLAQEKLYITTPYFIPDLSIKNILKQSALGGVDVRLLIPDTGDSLLVSLATKSYIGDLLRSNVKVYLYKKGFIHAKTIVADSFLSVIGTANMDVRSLSLNFEINSVIYDVDIAQQMESQFLMDLQDSKQVLLHEYEQLPGYVKLGYRIARLVSDFL